MDKADGNTEIIGRTKALRSRAWFFTLNNPLKHSFLNIKDVISIFKGLDCVMYMIQLEKGENGTPHYQGCMYFKHAVQLNTLKQLSKNFIGRFVTLGKSSTLLL